MQQIQMTTCNQHSISGGAKAKMHTRDYTAIAIKIRERKNHLDSLDTQSLHDEELDMLAARNDMLFCVVQDLAELMTAENKRFSRDQFIAACGFDL